MTPRITEAKCEDILSRIAQLEREIIEDPTTSKVKRYKRAMREFERLIPSKFRLRLRDVCRNAGIDCEFF